MAGQLSATLRARIRSAAANQCGCCLTSQAYVPWALEIDHIIPRAHGGTDAEENLWLACRACNLFKGQQSQGPDPVTGQRIPLFHPRRQRWGRHLQWSPDGTMIMGQTATGRATVVALCLNNFIAVTVRRNWVAAG